MRMTSRAFLQPLRLAWRNSCFSLPLSLILELTPIDWTLFRRILVQIEGQGLLLSPLLLELRRGEIAERRMNTFMHVHVIKEAT